jgi:quinol monooxygenase YgiN
MEKIVIVRWRIKASETARVLAMLPELAEKSRNEDGNLSYAIYRSEADPNELVLHERYVDAAAAESHRQSEHYQRIVVDGIIPHLDAREVIPVMPLL